MGTSPGRGDGGAARPAKSGERWVSAPGRLGALLSRGLTASRRDSSPRRGSHEMPTAIPPGLRSYSTLWRPVGSSSVLRCQWWAHPCRRPRVIRYASLRRDGGHASSLVRPSLTLRNDVDHTVGKLGPDEASDRVPSRMNDAWARAVGSGDRGQPGVDRAAWRPDLNSPSMISRSASRWV